jgi:hypothetical protein
MKRIQYELTESTELLTDTAFFAASISSWSQSATPITLKAVIVRGHLHFRRSLRVALIAHNMQRTWRRAAVAWDWYSSFSPDRHAEQADHRGAESACDVF